MKSDESDNISERHLKKPYYFETADLVIIALFAALGGVSSSFIGSIIRAIFQPIALPAFGQIMAGIHIFWYIIVFLLTDRKLGAVTLTGTIKGCVEFFTGSSLGIIAFFLSFIAALIFEIVYFSFILFKMTSKLQTLVIGLAGGFSSASNVIILMEALLNSFSNNNFPPEWIIVVFSFAFISGVIFSYIGLFFYNEFQKAGMLDWRKKRT